VISLRVWITRNLFLEVEKVGVSVERDYVSPSLFINKNNSYRLPCCIGTRIVQKFYRPVNE